MASSRLKKNWTVIVLLVFALLVRVFIFQRIKAGFHTDSLTYLILSDLETVRTPGYPFFIEAIQFMNDLFSLTSDYLGLIAFVQMFFLGILNCYLIFRVAKTITQNKPFSLAIGLLYNLDYLVIGFEFQILTETLSVTLVLTTLLLYLRMFEKKKYAPYLAGISSAFLLLTRPTFLLLFIGLLLLTATVHFREVVKGAFLKRFGKAMLVFLLINVAAIGSWSMRNKIRFNYFGISSLLPFQLRHYTDRFFEKYKKDDDEFLNKLVDIYLEENRNPTRFEERLKAEMNMSFTEISRHFLRMNLKVIKDNPGDYLRQVPEAMAKYYLVYSNFWTVPYNRKLLNKKSPITRTLRLFFQTYRYLFTHLISLLIMVAAMPLIALVLVRKNQKVFHTVLIIEGIINYNFLASVLSCNADNLRYRVPVEPLILLIFFSSFFFLSKYMIGLFKK